MICKQCLCPPRDQWIKKKQYLYPKGGISSAIKKNKCESGIGKWMHMDVTVLRKVS